MSPRQSRTYKAPRDRREVVFAVLGVLAVLVFTGVMLYILKPADPSTPAPIPPISLPSTTAPVDPSATTVPATTDTTATSAPAG
jgi:hypothetical protein